MSERQLRIALLSVNQTPIDWRGNFDRLSRAFTGAREAGARIVCSPELAITGYGCEDLFYSPDVADRAWDALDRLRACCGDEVWLVGLPVLREHRLYNTVAVLHRGRIAGFIAKVHLAQQGIHYEARWFSPWTLGRRAGLRVGPSEIPFGNFTFDVAGLRFGIEICEDAWVDEGRPAATMNRPDLIFNASASHFSLGKAQRREDLVTQSSDRFGVTYAYANLVGCESGRAIYDGELLVSQAGNVVARSRRFTFQEDDLLTFDLRYTPKRNASKDSVTLDLAPSESPTPQPCRTDRDRSLPEEEFAFAASLGLWDYMRKSRHRGFALSLSGGVDSGTVAVLVAILAHRLIAQDTRIRDAVRHFVPWDRIASPKDLVQVLLLTVYQSTRNSSPATRRAAGDLARAIGARHFHFDVESLVHTYESIVTDAIGRPLDWTSDDIPRQNIQARVRGPGIWMMANIERRLLLATSNRSEVAVGYATMDGDTCGGLAPIAGIQKTFLRRWLRIIEEHGLKGFPAMPALSAINALPPTAELRPLGSAQTDETDLMPYEVLDQLERLITSQRLGPIGAYRALLEKDLAPPKQILDWTQKFCRLFANSQWKRERYAPAFHLDDQNLDPKTWARYPILSGAFAAELEELERLAAQTSSDTSRNP